MTWQATLDPGLETLELQWDAPGAAQPQASIVLTTWQYERFAAAAVRSAMAQTVPFELVVRDDGSTDRTVDAVLAEVSASLPGSLATRVLVLRGLENRGLGYNFTRAVGQCRCEWIFNFDGDDISSPDRVALGLAELSKVADAHVLFARCVHAEDIEALPAFGELRAGHHGGGIPLPAACIGATMAVRRDLVDRFGPLPDRIVSHDHLLESRAIVIGRVARLHVIVVKRRWHETNITHRIWGPSEHKRLISAHRDVVLRLQDFAECVCTRIHAGDAVGRDVPVVAQSLLLSVLRGWSSGLGSPGPDGLRAMRRLAPLVASKLALADALLRAGLRPLKRRIVGAINGARA